MEYVYQFLQRMWSVHSLLHWHLPQTIIAQIWFLETLKATVHKLPAVYQNTSSCVGMEKSAVSLDTAILNCIFSVLINFLNSGVTLQSHVMDRIYLLQKRDAYFAFTQCWSQNPNFKSYKGVSLCARVFSQRYINCDLLHYHTACSGNFVPTFWNNLSVLPSWLEGTTYQ